jgi:hypothetical protein
VVIRNVSVVRSIAAANPLPVADTISHTGRIAMSTPMTVPTTPSNAASNAASWPTLIARTILGIYKFDKDQFTVCFASTDKERPKEFSVKAGTGDFIHVWKKKAKE